MKSKGLRILLAVLIVWAGVSFYFYTQHKFVVQEYDLSKTVKVGETQVIFKQVCFTTYSNKTRPAVEEYNIPWYFKAANHLPAKMQLPFIKVCNFYRHPYQVNPDGTLKVKGIIISPEPYTENEGPLGKSVDIDLYYGKDKFTLTGRQQEWGSNVCLFSLFGDHVPDAVDEVTAVVTDKATGEAKSTVIKPVWDTLVYHGTWRPEFPFSPEETLRQLVIAISDKSVDKEELQPFVLSTVRDQFPWQDLQHNYWRQAYKTEMTYQGNYMGRQDVYSIKLMFLAGSEKTVATQAFYLVEQENAWKIINVSKAENIKVQNQTSQATKDGNDTAAPTKLFTQFEAAEQFVKSQGYSIMMNSGANFDLQLPVSFDEIKNDVLIGDLLKKRNEISKQNGFDFSSYLGKKVTLITYGVKNEKNEEANIDLILDGNKIVGFWVDHHLWINNDGERPDFNVIVNAYQ